MTLLDCDYLIAKELEEVDDSKDFVQPVTFRPAANTGANDKDFKKGNSIQFERKGYSTPDGTTGEGDTPSSEFTRIPDGKQPSLASKHVPAPRGKPTNGGRKKDKLGQIYRKGLSFENDNVKMYKVDNAYDAQVGAI